MTGKEMAEHIRGWLDSEGFNCTIEDGRIHPSQYPDFEELDAEGKSILLVLMALERVENQREELRKTLYSLV